MKRPPCRPDLYARPDSGGTGNAAMTGAFAFAAARVMRSGFSPASLPAFDEAIHLAAVCSRADALDVFCDGIAAMVSMTPAEREAAVETFHSDVACATC